MARKTSRAPLSLSRDDQQMLESLAKSLTQPLRRVRRAKMLLLYSSGATISEVSREVGVSRDVVYKWVDRALALGPSAALDDKYHRAHDPTITLAAKAWVIELACLKPKDLGYAAELWTMKALAEHVRIRGPKQGHPCRRWPRIQEPLAPVLSAPFPEPQITHEGGIRHLSRGGRDHA